jgi:hypothetical protein
MLGGTYIGTDMFLNCTALTNITLPDGLIGFGDEPFANCSSLINITIPGSVTDLWQTAFAVCPNLKGVFFKGNAPTWAEAWVGAMTFLGSTNVIVYYLPGTTGWDTTFSGRPTALWFLPNPAILNFKPNFGVQPNGFGFTISWATNIPVVVEACTNLSNPAWLPVQTNALTDGSAYFSDSQWTNYPGRFYRLRSP